MSQLVPLYGFVEGDTMGVLVMAHDDMRLDRVGEMLRQSASVRVAMNGPWVLIAGGRELNLTHTVAQEGLRAIDRLDLRRKATS